MFLVPSLYSFIVYFLVLHGSSIKAHFGLMDAWGTRFEYSALRALANIDRVILLMDQLIDKF